jgi:hypothetical protein
MQGEYLAFLNVQVPETNPGVKGQDGAPGQLGCQPPQLLPCVRALALLAPWKPLDQVAHLGEQAVLTPQHLLVQQNATLGGAVHGFQTTGRERTRQARGA